MTELSDDMLEMMGLTREDVALTIPVVTEASTDEREQFYHNSYDYDSHKELGERYYFPNGF